MSYYTTYNLILYDYLWFDLDHFYDFMFYHKLCFKNTEVTYELVFRLIHSGAKSYT